MWDFSAFTFVPDMEKLGKVGGQLDTLSKGSKVSKLSTIMVGQLKCLVMVKVLMVPIDCMDILCGTPSNL